ncbi:hypothetical protein ABFX02_05G018600 [Erythranthe guttata]
MSPRGTTVISSSLALLATTFILLSTTATAHAVESRKAGNFSPFCRTAHPTRALCTQMVNGAKTWPQAMTNAILATAVKAKAAVPMAAGVAKRLPVSLFPESRVSIGSTCTEAIDNIIFDLGKCVEFVKNDPTSALKTYLSSITFFDCRNALEEFEVSLPEVSRFDQEMTKLAGVLLSVLETKP